MCFSAVLINILSILVFNLFFDTHTPHDHIILRNIYHCSPVALFFQLLEHFFEENQLSARLDHRSDLKETVGRQGGLLSRT